MRLIYVTTEDPKSQGDYLEVSMLHGLREVLGAACIDFPRKKIMYGDFSDSPKNDLHGKGFSLLTYPIEDIDPIERISFISEANFTKDCEYIVLYGCTEAYGMDHNQEINKNAKSVWFLDGHDHSRILRKPCFKRELFQEEEDVYPIGFGIPEHRIRPIDFSFANKTQLIQKTAPFYSKFGPQILGQDMRQYYIYDDEEEYYRDMERSWFGLHCKRGGWDSLRYLEIMASGALLLFRDYDKKPELCSPAFLPCLSYSNPDELNCIFDRLLVDGKPTQEYIDLLCGQREWIWTQGTTKARALQIIKVLENVQISM